MISPDALADVMAATWPPASTWRHGPFLLRDGAGGGKRVSAATVAAAWTQADLIAAETAMQDRGGPALFMLRPQDADLDAALAARGYAVVDPVVTYAISTQALTPPPRMATFPHWPPLHIATELWAGGHIGPARLAVMHRAAGPKTAILARSADRAVGVAYVALHQNIAMLHALEVSRAFRRQGCAQNILRAAAVWAGQHGADTLALVVTQANNAARSLYASLGMQAVEQYHYRQK